jgi:RHS repeat-associated protein
MGSTTALYGQDRLGLQENGATTWLLSDALGSVRQTADSGGTPGWGIWYDPWGQVEQGSVPTFGFAGEQHNTFTGQVYLRARWYAPGQGRFLSQDSYLGSMERPDTLHLYAYVGNSPLNRTDRTGHCYGPATFLRDWEPTNCTNLDMALRIAQHPQASALEREFAKDFILSFIGGHAPVLIALGMIGWQATMTANAAFTAASQWGSVQIIAGTGAGQILTTLGLSAVASGTIETAKQVLNGDPTTLAFLACPAAFGMGSLWVDLADTIIAGKNILFPNPALQDDSLGVVLANDGGGYFYDHQKGSYDANGTVYGQVYRNTCVPATCQMILADKGIESDLVVLAKLMKVKKDGTPLSMAEGPMNTYLTGTGVRYKYVEPTFSQLRQFSREGPVIVGVRAPDAPDEHIGHAIIVDGIDSNRVYLRDSLPETRGTSYSVSIQDFLVYWKGIALVIDK